MTPAGEAASAPNWAQMLIESRDLSLRRALTAMGCVAAYVWALMLSVTLLEVPRHPVRSQSTSDMPATVKTGTAVSLAPAT